MSGGQVHAPTRYLALRGGQLTAGKGGPFCELSAFCVGKDLFVLRNRSLDQGDCSTTTTTTTLRPAQPCALSNVRGCGSGVGVDRLGRPRPPKDVKYDIDAQFTVKILDR